MLKIEQGEAQYFRVNETGLEKSKIELDTIERVRSLVQIKGDSYKCSNVDLSQISDFSKREFRNDFKVVFPHLVEEEKSKGQHIVVATLNPDYPFLYKYVLKQGFQFHQANGKFAVATKCLHSHSLEQCPYPGFKSLSTGITCVIFNSDLTEFLAIKEKVGPYLGWKATTGSVDCDKEMPADAAVREMFEETGFSVAAEDIRLAGVAWTKNLRGNKPDLNFVFSARCEKSEEILPQESEVSEAKWISVDEFLHSDLPVSHSKPLVVKGVVAAAKRSFESLTETWQPHALHWGSGKDVTLYCPPINIS